MTQITTKQVLTIECRQFERITSLPLPRESAKEL